MEGGLSVRHPHDPLGCLVDALGQIADRGHRVGPELDRLEHAVLAVAGDDPGPGVSTGGHATPPNRGRIVTAIESSVSTTASVEPYAVGARPTVSRWFGRARAQHFT